MHKNAILLACLSFGGFARRVHNQVEALSTSVKQDLNTSPNLANLLLALNPSAAMHRPGANRMTSPVAISRDAGDGFLWSDVPGLSDYADHLHEQATTKQAEEKKAAVEKAAREKAAAKKKAAEEKAAREKEAVEKKKAAKVIAAKEKEVSEKKAVAEKAASDKEATEKKAAEVIAAREKEVAEKKAVAEKAASDKEAKEKKVGEEIAARAKEVAEGQKKIPEEKALVSHGLGFRVLEFMRQPKKVVLQVLLPFLFFVVLMFRKRLLAW